mmetsp:Transcript_20813/g.39552  ORF Transcript_20813/g.39552 Transcript_20813/m.39552 type:complete len:226 (+) Transcript_20813:1635-2312(+)
MYSATGCTDTFLGGYMSSISCTRWLRCSCVNGSGATSSPWPLDRLEWPQSTALPSRCGRASSSSRSASSFSGFESSSASSSGLLSSPASSSSSSSSSSSMSVTWLGSRVSSSPRRLLRTSSSSLLSSPGPSASMPIRPLLDFLMLVFLHETRFNCLARLFDFNAAGASFCTCFICFSSCLSLFASSAAKSDWIRARRVALRDNTPLEKLWEEAVEPFMNCSLAVI